MAEEASSKDTQQLCCIACGYKSGKDVQDIQNCSRAAKQSERARDVQDSSMASRKHEGAGDVQDSSMPSRKYEGAGDVQDCSMASRKHEWAGNHACSSGSLRCSSWVSGQLQVWSRLRKEADQSSALDSLSDTTTVASDTSEESLAPVLDDTEVLAKRPVINDQFYNDDSYNEPRGSRDNYTPAEMTFCKRKLNSSSSNRAPVAKRGKRENKVVDLSRIPGPGLDRTWKPELDEDLDKTFVPGTLPSDSDESDEFPDAMSAGIPSVCTNCEDAQAPVAWCKDCTDDPYLCARCVWAHRRVGLTKRHQISFKLQDSKDDEDPLKIFEKILNSVHPGRKTNDVSSGSETDFDGLPDIPDLAGELRLIRQNSSSLVNRLTKSNSVEGSSGLDGHPCADSRMGGLECHDIKYPFSRSNSESSSNGGSYKARKVRASSVNTTSELSSSGSDSSGGEGKRTSALTERIIADNLLPILNVDSDEVKMKTAVVIEMLVKSDVVNPSVFCDIRCIRGFKSLLSTKDRRILKTTLSSLDQFTSALGRKGIFFGLVRMENELGDILKTMQKQADVKDAVDSILNRFDRLLGH